MDFELEYRYTLECELDKRNGRICDNIRKQLLQLVASKSTISNVSYYERLKELLQEYSIEIDRNDGVNTFIDSSLFILENECKNQRNEFFTDEWKSSMKQKFDNNECQNLRFFKKYEKLKQISQKFREFNQKRLISLIENETVDTQSESDNDDSNSNSQKQKKLVKSSPTRVPGLFRKKSSSTAFTRNLFAQTDVKNSQSPQKSSDSDKCSSQESIKSGCYPISSSLPKIEESVHEHHDAVQSSQSSKHNDLSKKSSFITGLEKHLVDQIVNNELETDEAKEIIDSVRKEKSSTFKDPMTVKKQSDKSSSALLNDERLKGIDPNMIELISGEIISNLNDTDWANIAGLDFAKSTIQRIAIQPLKRPDLFTGIRAPQKGILLFGPPGTGKTMIGRCIASQAKATFFSITSSTLTSKWIGDGEKTMKTLFQVARCLRPSVIFIDEIDSLLKSRSDSEHEASRRMKTEFLSQFDGLSKETNEGLLIIGTTNRPHELDEAVRRRFAARLYVPLPEKSARKQMIINNLKSEKHSLTDEQIDNIAEHTESFSGSDMKILCHEASMVPMMEICDRITEITQDEIREICYDDFQKSLQIMRPSISADDLGIYENWNKNYGTNGR